MNWFTPAVHDHHLERDWILWDRWLLHELHGRALIEAPERRCHLFRALLRAGLRGRASLARRSFSVTGASGSIDSGSHIWRARWERTRCFPISRPSHHEPSSRASIFPRRHAVRRFNLWIVGGYGIHSSVFPSAHVSSALSAAWGLLATIPERRGSDGHGDLRILGVYRDRLRPLPLRRGRGRRDRSEPAGGGCAKTFEALY